MKPTTRWMQIVLLSLLCACGGGSDSTENNRSHQTIDLNSGIMQDSYPLTVILPEDYANQVMPLPVILVLDGRWHQERVAEEVAATGTAAIVVGIGNDQRREPDFVPPDFHGSLGLSDGLADDYVDMLRNEILPTLEQRYNINPEQRYIVGHSLGGLLVEYALLTDNPDDPTFRGYCMSDSSNFSQFLSTHHTVTGSHLLCLGNDWQQSDRPVGCQTDGATSLPRIANDYPQLRDWTQWHHGTRGTGRHALFLPTCLVIRPVAPPSPSVLPLTTEEC